MLGLFGTLNLANKSLQTQRLGMEVAGHNLANVNTPGYSRQQVRINSSFTIPSNIGPQGTGADAVGIRQVRDTLLDRRLQDELSVSGSLEARQKGLQFMQSSLGQTIDRQASGASGAAASSGVGGQHGLAEEMSDLFNAFQSLSTNPTSSVERQSLLMKAQSLALQFNQVSQRLDDLRTSLDDTLQTDVQTANTALADIAKLNEQIAATEIDGKANANDLRDLRQQKLEDLAKLVKFESRYDENGMLSVSVGDTTLVAGRNVVNQLETYDAGGGQLLVRASATQAPLAITGGSIHGTIVARDQDLSTMQTSVDQLAANLITEVNAIHRGGFGLNGATGEDFFTGANAATMGVNAVLLENPSAIQAGGVAGEAGDNQTVLALAQLAQKKIPALNGQTLQQHYSQSITRMGEALSSTNVQLSNQQIVEDMLTSQRDSVSGVSLDEEMTDLIRYQRAFEASAKLIVTIDEMLETVLSLKR